jgi:hypothetical protein
MTGRILLLGTTGRTGRLALEYALSQGIELLIRHALNLIAVRAEPVEAQESIHISTRPLVLSIVEGSMRTDSWIKCAGSIVRSTPAISER